MAQARYQAGECPSVDDIIANWDDTPKKAAKQMMERYGPPNEATPSRLIWYNNGPWQVTEIRKQEIEHKFPVPHKDVLQQTIPYQVPVDKVDDLAAYDGSVIVERTRGTISARCDREEANFLALNLANDIVQGNKTVDQAREYYTETIGKLMGGDKPQYTQGLQFSVPSADKAADPDETTMSQTMMAAAKEKMHQMGEKLKKAV